VAGGSSGTILGHVLIIAGCAAWAVWFVMQTRMVEDFSVPYTSMPCASSQACMQCIGVSAAMDRNLNIWKLTWTSGSTPCSTS
jgi:drug/metabolite transporter (DMT)-like permease